MSRHRPASPSAPLASAIRGLVWPAIPPPAARAMLALQCQLDRSQWWSRDALLAHQMSQLHRLVGHAIRTVPAYRDHLASCGVNVVEDLDPDSFRSWPILEKQAIQVNPGHFLAREMPPDHGLIRSASTSGSSGQPLKVAVSERAIFFQQSMILRFQFWNRLDYALKFAVIKMSTQEASLPSWGPPASLIGKTGPSVTQSVFLDHRAQLEWLIKEAPAYLLAHNTNLRALLRLSEVTGRRPSGMKLLLGYTDMAGPESTELARELWGAHFVDTYSCTEVGTLALQCPESSSMHVQSERVYLEILRPDGTPCDPGETGRVVVTDLHNFAMPLIRYVLGDMAMPGHACTCGRGLPVLGRIVGRSGNLATDPTGRTFYPFLNLDFWESAAPILQRQIAQLAVDTLEVRYVAERDLLVEEADRLTGELRRALRFDYRIQFRRVDRINHGPGGKFEDFLPMDRLPVDR